MSFNVECVTNKAAIMDLENFGNSLKVEFFSSEALASTEF